MITRVEIDPKILVRDPAKLMLVPQVLWVTDFNDEAARQFAFNFNVMQQTDQPVIPIIIDSAGGEAYSMFAMVDVIRAAKVPVATVVVGKAMSAGAALFTCGTKGYRFVGPNATLMLHDISADDAVGKSEEVKVGAKETDRLNHKMWRMMEKNIGKPPGYLWKMVQERGHTDWYMTAQEAKKHGIANHIRIPALRTTVKVETRFG